MTIGTRLYTWLRGELVGSDDFGNRYYRERTGRGSPIGFNRERRWVMYDGKVEASKVPAEWHSWLHHIVKDAPEPGLRATRPWEKDHQPNLTGTGEAYRPPGHTLSGGQRNKATGDYEPWVPN